MRRATPSPGSSPCSSPAGPPDRAKSSSGGGSRPCSATSRRAASAWRTATSAAPSAWTASSSSWRWPCSGRSRPGCGTRSTAPRRTKKSPGPTTPQPPPRPDLPLQARHPPPPGVPATARRPTAVVGRVAELMGGKARCRPPPARRRPQSDPPSASDGALLRPAPRRDEGVHLVAGEVGDGPEDEAVLGPAPHVLARLAVGAGRRRRARCHGPHVEVHDVLAAPVDDHRNVAPLRVVETTTEQREAGTA